MLMRLRTALAGAKAGALSAAAAGVQVVHGVLDGHAQ
eukprot:gene5565-1845_t